jgi:hypothetical protein
MAVAAGASRAVAEAYAWAALAALKIETVPLDAGAPGRLKRAHS